MNRQEELQAQYEDALFALLMDDLAQKQGAEYDAENEQWKQAPELSALSSLDRKMQNIICCSSPKTRSHDIRHHFYRIVQNVSVAIVAVLLLAGTALAVSQPFRTYVLEIVVVALEDSTDFISSAEDSALFAGEEAVEISVTGIPDEYVLIECQQAEGICDYTYRDDLGNHITISISVGVGVVSVDTENGKVQDVMVQGNEGIAIDQENWHSVVWSDVENNCTVSVESPSLTTDELLLIAEEVSINQ